MEKLFVSMERTKIEKLNKQKMKVRLPPKRWIKVTEPVLAPDFFFNRLS